MSKETPIPTKVLENQAQNMWHSFDNMYTDQALTFTQKKLAKEEFWESYSELLQKAQHNATLLKPEPLPQIVRRPSPALQLTGTFMMTEKKLDDFKKRLFTQKQLPSILTNVGLVFTLLLINLGLHLPSLLIIAIISSFIILLRYKFQSTPLENTIIEIQSDKIVRRGNRLTTALILLEKVVLMQENKMGLMLRQAGFWNTLNYFLSENNTLRNSKVIFIPNAIESYDEIKVFLEERVAKNKTVI